MSPTVLDTTQTAQPPTQESAATFAGRSATSYSLSDVTSAVDRKDDILQQMRDNFTWGHEAEIWHRWAYEQSPYEDNQCWFVETDQRQTVGFTALMPRRMNVMGRMHDVGQTANLSVNADHRGTAAALKLQRGLVAHFDKSEMALSFGITRNAHAVQKRAGFHDLGLFSRWIKLFRTEHKLRKHIPWSLPRRAAATVIDTALRSRALETWSRLPRGWRVVLNPPFNERFDELWEQASRSSLVAGERSREYLEWRFNRDPQLKYQTLAVQNERGELRGYAIYLERDPEEALPFGAIVDLLVLDQQAADAVLTSLSKLMRRSGATGIQMVYFGSPLIEEGLQRSGYFRRSCSLHFMVRLHPSLMLRETELLDPHNWHITEAEGKF